MNRRVLMTADAVGGVWTYALELARALVPLGIETTIATMGPPPSQDSVAEARAISGLELLTSAFALEWTNDPWDDLDAAGDWLLAVEARVQPFVIHLNGFAHGALPWRAPVVLVGHSCVLSWRDAAGGDFDSAWLSRYRRIVTTGIRAADWVVAPSAAMLAELQRLYGPLRCASVISNGRSPAGFHSAVKEPFVLTGGRLWDRAKNAGALRTIAPRLAWPVVFAEQWPQPALIDHLARASIFALPARYEPFGLLPLEAALSHCALVLGDIASLREIWDEAATYVDPEDTAALQRAIEWLIDNPDHRQQLASRARERARRYAPETMARAYVRLYDALTKELRCAS